MPFYLLIIKDQWAQWAALIFTLVAVEIRIWTGSASGNDCKNNDLNKYMFIITKKNTYIMLLSYEIVTLFYTVIVLYQIVLCTTIR